jgi:hypothetical protein
LFASAGLGTPVRMTASSHGGLARLAIRGSRNALNPASLAGPTMVPDLECGGARLDRSILRFNGGRQDSRGQSTIDVRPARYRRLNFFIL